MPHKYNAARQRVARMCGMAYGAACFDAPDLAVMPHKYNADRRHHIPRPKRRVTNWAAYNEALRQRGSLTVWFTDDAIAAWKASPRTTPGGQPHYSDLAITTALTLRAVFPTCRCARRRELIGSILRLLGLDLPAPEFLHPQPASPRTWNCRRSPAPGVVRSTCWSTRASKTVGHWVGWADRGR